MVPMLTLGEFVKQLAALLNREKVLMPFKNQRPWHFLFYELKKDTLAPGRPAFLDRLVFDWDGPYPKSRDLSDFLHALHWNASVSASNPHYETINLTDEVADAWLKRFDKLDSDTKEFMENALSKARIEFTEAADGSSIADPMCAAK